MSVSDLHSPTPVSSITPAAVVADLLSRLIDAYGPMMTMEDVCQVTRYTRGGLRDALWGKRTPVACQLAATRRQIGRRAMWPTLVVARILAGGEAA